jgi:hypothetical protein
MERIMDASLSRWLRILPLAALCTWASPALAAPDKAVVDLLRGRAERACDQALALWLRSGKGLDNQPVRHAIAECYANLARLHVLGETQEAVAAGVTVEELPAWWLSAKTRMSLDPYLPLASRTLVAPKGDGR